MVDPDAKRTRSSGLVGKLRNTSAANVAEAVSAGDNYHANDANSAQYLFVCGGLGAGNLFYVGRRRRLRPDDRTILFGVNDEPSLDANHIVASPWAAW